MELCWSSCELIFSEDGHPPISKISQKFSTKPKKNFNLYVGGRVEFLICEFDFSGGCGRLNKSAYAPRCAARGTELMLAARARVSIRI